MTAIAAAEIEPRVWKLELRSADGWNLLSLDLLDAIAAAPDRHPGAQRFILAGNERCFSVGADLGEIGQLIPAVAWDLSRRGQRALDRIARANFVAAIEGYCLGGGLDLALACRARVCAPSAYLGHHGAKLGLVTGWGGTQRLPRLIGRARALEHLLAAEGWPAALALEHGLAQAVCPPAGLLAAAARVPLPG